MRNEFPEDPAIRWRWPHLCTKGHVREAAYITARCVRSKIAKLAVQEESCGIGQVTEVSNQLLELRRLIHDLLRRKDKERIPQLIRIRVNLLARLRNLAETSGINPTIIRRTER